MVFWPMIKRAAAIVGLLMARIGQGVGMRRFVKITGWRVWRIFIFVAGRRRG